MGGSEANAPFTPMSTHQREASLPSVTVYTHARHHKECVPLLSLFTVSQWTRAEKQLDVLPTRD